MALVGESEDFVESKSASADGAHKMLGDISVKAVVNVVAVRRGPAVAESVENAWVQGIEVSLDK